MYQQLGYRYTTAIFITIIKKRKVNIMNKHSQLTNISSPYTWEYHVFSEQYTHPDIGTYRSYGIRVYRIVDTNIEPVTAMHDVTSIQSQAEQLIELCNRHQLSPIHLGDFITDFLVEL